MSDLLQDQQLLRYSRQIMLPQIDVSGQQRLLSSHVLVLGVGGLGCPLLMYLASSGIGKITLIDPDVIELSNLQRQVLFNSSDIGQNKAITAKHKLVELNSEVDIIAIDNVLDDDEFIQLLEQVDVVIDGTDNFPARYRHSELCLKAAKPLVSGAVIRFEGQITTFDYRQDNAACYHCLYPQGEDANATCSENGVLGPVVGVIASIMATEAIKLIADVGELLTGRLMVFDALTMESRVLKFTKDPECSVCA